MFKLTYGADQINLSVSVSDWSCFAGIEPSERRKDDRQVAKLPKIRCTFKRSNDEFFNRRQVYSVKLTLSLLGFIDFIELGN